MANGAIHSRKARLEIKDGADWVIINGLKNLSGLGGGSASVIDVTDLQSDAKEKLIGLPDEGQASLSLNYIPTDAGQILLEEARLNGELQDFRAVIANTISYSFSGAVLTFEKSFGVDAVVDASATVEISGLVTKGTVTP